MSYCRYGSPLQWFRSGQSSFYVFVHVDGYVEDYDADFAEDPQAFLDMIGTIIFDETEDEVWTKKVLKILARMIGLEQELL